MIVSLAAGVQDRLAQVHQLELTSNALSNIQATLDELRKVEQVVDRLRAVMAVISPRLAVGSVADLQGQAERIADELESSHAAFKSNRRQVTELRTILRRVEQLAANAGALWTAYAGALIAPNREILALVRSLPEVAEQRHTIDALIAQLETQVQTPPQTRQALARFDTALDEVEHRLAAVKQLSPEVKAFLEKVRAGAATVADLTPAVLDWCRHGEHAAAFAISFVAGRGGRP